MKRSLLALALIILVAGFAGRTLAANLNQGNSGLPVCQLQQNLAFLGYFSGQATGYYGPQTAAAVRSFQLANRLTADGVAGPQTQAAIAKRVREKSGALASRRNDLAGLIPWEEVDRLFPRGTTARVYDIATGLAFVVWRLQGTFHADVEPLTQTDTDILRQICGGRWTQDRRAILVEIEGKLIAASMYPYPHGHEAIHDNGFNGQMCLHFLGSRVHKTGRVDPKHQEMVILAAQTNLRWGLASAEVESASPDSSALEAAVPSPARID